MPISINPLKIQDLFNRIMDDVEYMQNQLYWDKACKSMLSQARKNQAEYIREFKQILDDYNNDPAEESEIGTGPQTPSWKDILNPNHERHGHLDIFFQNIVFPSGYPYFLWNGRVYKVTDNSFEDTSYTQEDIEKG